MAKHILACIFTSIRVVFIEVSPDSILKTTNTMTGPFTLIFTFFNDNSSFGKWHRNPRDMDDLASSQKRDMWID